MATKIVCDDPARLVGLHALSQVAFFETLSARRFKIFSRGFFDISNQGQPKAGPGAAILLAIDGNRCRHFNHP
jgi:hypothetical protein